jgi:hypothetical protein
MSKKKSTTEQSATLAKTNTSITTNNDGRVDENVLFERVAAIIENRRTRAGSLANREATLMRWEIGYYVRSILLDGERAEYGKRIVTKLSSQLVERYGQTFDVHNLRRMIRFAEKFSDFEIVTKLSSQLSWSHIIALLPLESDEPSGCHTACGIFD